MRMVSIVSVVLALAACGCAEMAVAAIEDHQRATHAEEQERAARRAEQERQARNRAIWDRGRSLIARAREAARAGDCRTVGRIELDVLALPPVEGLEGGFHDTVFLRDEEVLPCLETLRLARAACTNQQAWVAARAGRAASDDERSKILETMPACDDGGAPVPVTYADRAVCVAARDAGLARVIAAGAPAARRGELENLPACPAATDAERANEQAWAWTKSAAIAAVFGTCEPAVDSDRRVAELDRDVHDAAYLREPDIQACIDQATRAAAKARDDHARCVHDREDRRRRALAIPDVRERGRALAALAECPGTGAP